MTNDTSRTVQPCGCVTIRDGWFVRVSLCDKHRETAVATPTPSEEPTR